MNSEIKNRRTDNESITRKIEVYRKNTTDIDSSSEPIVKNTEEPKNINRKDKIFFLSVGLAAGLVMLSFAILASFLFNNPFGSIPKNIEDQKTTPSELSVQPDKEGTLFFDKEGNIKISNFILTLVGVMIFFQVLRLIFLR